MITGLRRIASISALSIALATASNANAATFVFDSDPFAGSLALTTPGRQIVGGEPSITFNIAADTLVFDSAAFSVGNSVIFANGLVSSFPTAGLNVGVVQNLDNDSDLTTPFGAGIAANLIANQVTSDGGGFFVYFNSGLNLPRLVYSTNLGDPTADLAILARFSNLSGDTGALANFTAQNFDISSSAVPEPATWAMMLLGFGFVGGAMRAAKRTQRLTVA